LAQAERGVWVAWTDGERASGVSMAEIARKLQTARASLDDVACYAAEAANADEQSESDRAQVEVVRRQLQELRATARDSQKDLHGESHAS
jgi:hypothetical protein